MLTLTPIDPWPEVPSLQHCDARADVAERHGEIDVPARDLGDGVPAGDAGPVVVTPRHRLG